MLKIFNLNFIKKIFFYFSISYVIYALIKNFGQLSLDLQLNNFKINLILSVGFCLLSILLNALAWEQIIIWFGHNNNTKEIISTFISTNILKYIPGSIWHFLERFNFLKQKGDEKLAFYATIVEPYFMLAAALFLGSIGSLYFPPLILLILPTIFLKRDLIYFTIMKIDSIKNKSFRLFKIPVSKQAFDSKIKLNSIFPWYAFFVDLFFILFKFLGFISCFYIFNSYDPSKVILVFVVFCISWSVGLIIPAAPGGAGVFESCFLLFIRNYYPEQSILVAVIFFRFISTSSDLFLASPFFVKKLLRRN